MNILNLQHQHFTSTLDCQPPTQALSCETPRLTEFSNCCFSVCCVLWVEKNPESFVSSKSLRYFMNPHFRDAFFPLWETFKSQRSTEGLGIRSLFHLANSRERVETKNLTVRGHKEQKEWHRNFIHVFQSKKENKNSPSSNNYLVSILEPCWVFYATEILMVLTLGQFGPTNDRVMAPLHKLQIGFYRLLSQSSPTLGLLNLHWGFGTREVTISPSPLSPLREANIVFCFLHQ